MQALAMTKAWERNGVCMWRKQCRKMMSSYMQSKYSTHNKVDCEIRVGRGGG